MTVTVRGGTASMLSGTQTIGGVTATFYSCSTDRCNGGLALSSSLVLACAFVAVVSTVKWVTIN